jgi:phage terminase small subunit
MSNGLTFQQTKFVRNLATKNVTQEEAAILAGYSEKSANSISSQLIKNPKIVRALDKAGLTDDGLVETLKANIKAGSGIKATADTSLRGIELVYRLKGALDRPESPTSLSQTNIYVNELKTIDDNELSSKLDTLLQDVEALKKEAIATK